MGSGNHKVVIPKVQLEKIERWGLWAKQHGVFPEYLAAVKTIHYRLAEEPGEWGEPRYTLRHLGLEIRFGSFSMINVWFGVSKEKPLVFVKAFQFRGDYAAGRPPDHGVGGEEGT